MRNFFRNVAKGKRDEPLPAPHDGPPDSEHPSGLCPRCHKQSSFELLGSIPLTFDGGRLLDHNGGATHTHSERSSVLICRHCNQGVSVLEEQWVGDHRSVERKGGGPISWRGFQWWPLAGHLVHEAVPSEVGEAFNEALTSLAANCPRACVVMARRTLEAITAEKGQTSGPLAQRLERLASASVLHPTLSEWAKEVRIMGNLGAHFDPINIVSVDDARHLIKFIQELLNYIYILPSELKKSRGSP